MLAPAVLRAPAAALLHAGRRRTQALATIAASSEETVPAATSRAAPAEKDFLIRNAHNQVVKLECPTLPVLQQGLLETAHLPHICIAGESNAGKSSLINHLLKKHSLARASSVAGKTKSVDMMLVNEKVVVTDLPGLPSRDHQVAAMWERSWRPLVFQYIRRCERLHAMVYVHDVRWKVTSYVREFLDDVAATGLPVLLVLSKDDKIVNQLRPAKGETPEAARAAEIAERERLMTRVRRALDFEGVHLHYSVDTERQASRKARRSLLRYIESIVGCDSREATSDLLDQIATDKFARLSRPADAP